MNRSASVHSIEAIRDFRAALVSFCEDARDALVVLDLEAQRGLHWVQDEQSQYWQQQVRRRGEAVLRAKSDLDHARTMPVPGGHPSCREEKMAVERAKHQVAAAEDKIDTVRKWGHVVEHEVAEYQGRANQLMSLLDGKMPQAITFLDRVLAQLDAYLAVNTSTESAAPRAAGGPVQAVPATEKTAGRAAEETEESDSQPANSS